MDANFFAKLLEFIADFVSKMITYLQELVSALGIDPGDDDADATEPSTVA